MTNKIQGFINKIKGLAKQPYLPYSVFLLFSFLSVLFIIIVYNIEITNDGALYLLSAMAQVLAAILAIVIGFSFVAFQLSAQVGSPRVFDLILKGKALWLLLLIYGISILYDLLLLRILPEGKLDVFFTHLINIGIFLSLISFISLFPYSYSTIERIKPERIIQGIIRIKYNKPEQNDDVEQVKRDMILPIVDVMNKSIYNGDPHTFNVGLYELEKLNLDIIQSKINSKYKLEIIKYYSRKISKLLETAFEQNNDDFLIEMTDSIKTIGIISIKMRWSEVPSEEKERIKGDEKYISGIGLPGKTDDYDMIASEIKIVLSDASIKAIRKNWSGATRLLLNARGALLVTSHEELVLSIMDDIFQMSNDFSSLSNEGKIFSMDYFMEAIRNILLDLINKNVHFDEWHYTSSIKSIIKNSLEVIGDAECFKIRKISNYIIDIGIETAKRDHKLKDYLKNILIEISTCEKCHGVPTFEIGNRGFGLASNSQKLETLWICSCLKEIGSLYLLKKMDGIAYNIFSFLDGIENNYRQSNSNDVEEVTKKIIDIIEELANKSIIVEKYSVVSISEKSFGGAINSLIQIGMKNENITFRNRICEILKNFIKKPKTQKIFNSVIEINEKRQGNELRKFHEFYKFCGFKIQKKLD